MNVFFFLNELKQARKYFSPWISHLQTEQTQPLENTTQHWDLKDKIFGPSHQKTNANIPQEIWKQC